MIFYSPLRYPGGKNKLARFIAEICNTNHVDGHYVEPYAGGASVALYLLINNLVKEITINDFDKSIYAFWYSVINDTDILCHKIQHTNVTINNWKKQREIQKTKVSEKNLTKLGFSTLFLNRTNYSGIIDGGVIGGINQKGAYRLDCRFNKLEIVRRIRLIAQYKQRIHIKNLDAIDLIKKIKLDKNSIFYFDPPYYLKGPSLYMNAYKPDDHLLVSRWIQKIPNSHWIVSYDDTFEINKMYPEEIRRIKYSLLHTARNVRKGAEILFFSKNLVMPLLSNPVAVSI